jgi:hypothetical protein
MLGIVSLIIPECGRLRQKGSEFEDSLSYIAIVM